ncbi:hypothetical protein BJ138DRAFT_1181681 [Hygrophoropsis aurantiaca]|uniref:Uncharacterized protein n=2 Tax=Hygrophoropsis aurantiaca TaxID=72124 RepID=A0ACB8A666_9AGAM|nr:hypothetical protein BJ138DRAFT_1184095 [Hygrophoropsis aurantiaca]KAH7908527.1 hypothetical protein BJ138DRAFT_1181681 [Hygrophoropsis aurantiaca]
MTCILPPDPAQELDQRVQWNAPWPVAAEQQPDFNSPSINATSRSLTFTPRGPKPKWRFFASEEGWSSVETPGFYDLSQVNCDCGVDTVPGHHNDPGTASPTLSASPIPSPPTPRKENCPTDADNLVPGSKRVRDSDDPVSFGEEMGHSRTKVSKSFREKAAKSDLGLKMGKYACAHYRCLLSTENPLPLQKSLLSKCTYRSTLDDLSVPINSQLVLSPFEDPSEVVINIVHS